MRNDFRYRFLTLRGIGDEVMIKLYAVFFGQFGPAGYEERGRGAVRITMRNHQPRAVFFLTLAEVEEQYPDSDILHATRTYNVRAEVIMVAFDEGEPPAEHAGILMALPPYRRTGRS